jgi:thymidylate synthase (FAD)
MSIRISDGPRVFLVGINDECCEAIGDFYHSEGIDPGEMARATDADGSESLIEIAGRLCYQSFRSRRPGGISAYLSNILESRHGSVLEHAVFNFIITGVSRSFSHEMVRHRAGMSYSQLSQRFVDESSCSFVVPDPLARPVRMALEILDSAPPGAADVSDPDVIAGLRWVESVAKAMDGYAQLSDYLFGVYRDVEDKTLRRKRAREAARSVLPNATETKLFVTGNARSVRHFVELRSAVGADREIRRVAGLIHDAVLPECPHVFGDYEARDTGDGLREFTTSHVKV